MLLTSNSTFANKSDKIYRYFHFLQMRRKLSDKVWIRKQKKKTLDHHKSMIIEGGFKCMLNIKHNMFNERFSWLPQTTCLTCWCHLVASPGGLHGNHVNTFANMEFWAVEDLGILLRHTMSLTHMAVVSCMVLSQTSPQLMYSCCCKVNSVNSSWHFWVLGFDFHFHHVVDFQYRCLMVYR